MIFSLCFKARLFACHDLTLEGGFDDPRHSYKFQIRCEICGRAEDVSVKVQNNFERRCPVCHALAQVRALPGFGEPHNKGGMPHVPRRYTEMMRFQINGAYPRNYTFGGGWEVKSLHQVFRNIDLSEYFNTIPTETYDATNEEFVGEVHSDAEDSLIEISNPRAAFFFVAEGGIFQENHP